MNHLWTLIHMHVGAPCRIKDLDKLSDDVFNLGYRGTYKICVYYLASNSHGYCSTSWIARKLKIRAAEIRKGVLLYKKQLLLDKTNLSPMKLGYLGIERSMKLWRDGGELTSSVWGETDPAFVEDLLDPDLEIDAIRCTACKKVEEGTNLMLECACKCVLYCSKACQVRERTAEKCAHSIY